MPHPLRQQSHPENACNEICPKSWTSVRRSKRLRGAQGQVQYNAPSAELKGKGFLCPSCPAGQGGHKVGLWGERPGSSTLNCCNLSLEKSKLPPKKLALFLMVRVQPGARWHDSVCFNWEKRKSTFAKPPSSEVRGEHEAPVTLSFVTTRTCVWMQMTRGQEVVEEQIGFTSDILLIDKDDRCSRKHCGPDSDVNAVNCYLLTVLLF